MTTKWFLNWTEEDFEWTYDNEKWTFKAHEHRMLKDYLADHFAKHLTDREMHKADLQVNHFSREEYLSKCFVSPEGVAEDVGELSEEKAEAEAMTANAMQEVKKKRGRPKKVEEQPKEAEFEGVAA